MVETATKERADDFLAFALKLEKEKEAFYAQKMEECRRVCDQGESEAEMDAIVDGAALAKSDAKPTKLTRVSFVTLFVDPLFNRIESNETRLENAKELVEASHDNQEDLAQTFNDLKSKTDAITLHKTSAMAHFMRKMVEKDVARQKELDDLWDQMRGLGMA